MKETDRAIKELVENVADLVVLVEPLLVVRRVLRAAYWLLSAMMRCVSA